VVVAHLVELVATVVPES
jgi:hypothetical protein